MALTNVFVIPRMNDIQNHSFLFFDIFLFLQYNLDILDIFATESGQCRILYRDILTTILNYDYQLSILQDHQILVLLFDILRCYGACMMCRCTPLILLKCEQTSLSRINECCNVYLLISFFTSKYRILTKCLLHIVLSYA